MRFKRSLMIAAAGAAITLSDVAAASAGTWQDNHPRRAEVNGRLDNQYARVQRDYRDGRITAGQAATMHAEDHSIRVQERADARFDGGHITPAEQRSLNREENGMSRQIYNQSH